VAGELTCDNTYLVMRRWLNFPRLHCSNTQQTRERTTWAQSAASHGRRRRRRRARQPVHLTSHPSSPPPCWPTKTRRTWKTTWQTERKWLIPTVSSSYSTWPCRTPTKEEWSWDKLSSDDWAVSFKSRRAWFYSTKRCCGGGWWGNFLRPISSRERSWSSTWETTSDGWYSCEGKGKRGCHGGSIAEVFVNKRPSSKG